MAAFTPGSLTFTTDDGPDFCSPSLCACLVDGSEGYAIPLRLGDLDVSVRFYVKGMEGAQPYVLVFLRDRARDLQGGSDCSSRWVRSRGRRGCGIGRRAGRELRPGDLKGKLESNPLRVR